MDVFSEFKDIFNIISIHSQIFGLMPLTFNKRNFYTSKPKSFYNILLIVLNLSSVAYSMCALPKFHFLPNMTIKITLVGEAVSISGSIIYSMLRSNKLTEFLRNIIEFDVNLQESCRVINYKENRRNTLFRLLKIYIFFVVYAVSEEYLSPWSFYFIKIRLSLVLHGFILVLFNRALCFLTTELVQMLKIRFVILNKQLDNLVQDFNFQYANTLTTKILRQKFQHFMKIATLHHLLSKSITLFNDFFGLTLLLMFGLNFFVIVNGSFFASAQIQANEVNWKHLLFALLPCINSAICLFNVCDVCYSTVEEVK
jgi:hypothetical protein